MMGCKMPWWAGSETPPPDKDKMIADLRAELSNEQEKVRKLELENSMSNCETVAWYEGHDAAVAGCCKRWEEALTLPIPALGVMNDPLESLYRATEALRAEVASLKEERDAVEIASQHWCNESNTLTQQLAAAKEYAERLIVALEEIADDSAHAAAQDALALPKPWDAIRKSEG